MKYLKAQESDILECSSSDLDLDIYEDYGLRLHSCELVVNEVIQQLRISGKIKNYVSEALYHDIRKYRIRKDLKKYFKSLFVGLGKRVELKTGKIRNPEALKMFIFYTPSEEGAEEKILGLVFRAHDHIDLDNETTKKKLKQVVEHMTQLLFIRMVLKDAYHMWKIHKKSSR